MRELTDRTFGFLIAYLLPGFVLLSGLGVHFEMVRDWLTTTAENAPTIGGFLYATLASLAAGMTLAALRWLVVEAIHHETGVERPDWDFSVLQENLDAFQGAVENHYRHHQFFGSMAVVTLLLMADARSLSALLAVHPVALATALAGLTALFFAASRDAMKKYYARAGAILDHESGRKGEGAMTNGWKHTRDKPDDRRESARPENEGQAVAEQREKRSEQKDRETSRD